MPPPPAPASAGFRRRQSSFRNASNQAERPTSAHSTGEGPGDLRAGQPSHDRAAVARLDSVEDGPSVQVRRKCSDQSGVSKHQKMTGRGGSAEADLLGERRRPPGREGERRDDLASNRVGEELDAGSVSFGHVDRVTVARPAHLAIDGRSTLAHLGRHGGTSQQVLSLDRTFPRIAREGEEICVGICLGVGCGTLRPWTWA